MPRFPIAIRINWSPLPREIIKDHQPMDTFNWAPLTRRYLSISPQYSDDLMLRWPRDSPLEDVGKLPIGTFHAIVQLSNRDPLSVWSGDGPEVAFRVPRGLSPVRIPTLTVANWHTGK